MNRLPNSAYADSKARRYPIIDRTHVRVAILTIEWRMNHHPASESISYLKGVHDRILERADELGMVFPHDCELCDTKVKVQFT